MIRRHDHDHVSTEVLCLAAARHADIRAEMARRDDNRNFTGDVLQDRLGEDFALFVGKYKLLREVSQDAEAIGASIYHEFDAAELPFDVELAVSAENCRDDGKYPAITRVWMGDIHYSSCII